MAAILLVEDHIDTATATCRLLERSGHRVQVANCKVDALRLCDEHEFDLMLLDLKLPNGRGRELIRDIRAKCPLRILVCSAFGQPQDIEASLSAGAIEHLVKPVSAPVLLDAIQRVLTTHVDLNRADADRPSSTDFPRDRRD